MPIWVTFPGLPIQYWSLENFSRIASYLGKLICTNSLTAGERRISYTRMLIEMDVTQLLPEHILIKVPDGNTKRQELDHDLWPKYCKECIILGHETLQFPLKKQNKPPPEPSKAPVPTQDKRIGTTQQITKGVHQTTTEPVQIGRAHV